MLTSLCIKSLKRDLDRFPLITFRLRCLLCQELQLLLDPCVNLVQAAISRVFHFQRSIGFGLQAFRRL